VTRQLPAGTCIGHAIRSVRNNIAYAFRISWPWYTVVLLASLGASVLLEALTGGDIENNPGPAVPIYIVLGFINLVSFASIAVNWHRYILLDEVPSGSELFRLDDKTWRYLGNLILVMLIMIGIVIAIVLPVFVLAASSESLRFLSFLAVLVAYCFAVVVLYRLSVKLPAIALGRHDFRMRDAWAVTRDNKLSIFIVAVLQFLLALAMLLAIVLVILGLSSANAILGLAVGTVAQVVAGWLLSIFGITILTSLYGFFVEGRDF
jgi:hypothetical protein